MSLNTNASLSAMLDMAAATNSLAAYAMLAANGFLLEDSKIGETMAGGKFHEGDVARMPDVFPPGGTVTLVLAAWNSGAANWSAAQSAGAKQGLIAFLQPTADYTPLPPPVPPTLSWTVQKDLVMMCVPEPSVLTVGVVGVAVLLILRSRAGSADLVKNRRVPRRARPHD